MGLVPFPGRLDDRLEVRQLRLPAEVFGDAPAGGDQRGRVTRAAGRGGLGAVMGSKNLKAVAVRGTQRLPISDRKRLTAVAKWFGENYKNDMAWAIEYGTVGNVVNHTRTSNLPTHNYRDPHFEGAENIDGRMMHRTILVERDTCQSCPVYCKQVVEYNGATFPDEPAFQTEFASSLSIDRVYGGPEYETLGALGSACGISDLLAVAKANEMTARWGLDSISLGMTIAYVMECVDAGLLTAEDTGGFAPTWGDAQGMLDAVEMIAHRRGFGDRMAEGSKRLAAWIGGDADERLVEVKGQELPMHEPRLKHALGVGYAVAPVGADHMMNMHDTSYTRPGSALDRVAEVQTFEPLPLDDLGHQKMELFYHEVNWQHAQDCTVTCHFYPYRYSDLALALSGATGHDYSARDILEVGERAQTLSRLFNLREGFTAADDRLPRRVMKAFEAGPLAGVEITEDALVTARNYWYGLMGWTPDGTPTRERIVALGLDTLLSEGDRP